MAAMTWSFTEVTEPTERRLNQLKKMTYGEIFWELGKNFCVALEDVKMFPYMYAEILPYCQRITSKDDIELYVASKKVHYIGCDEKLYRSMSAMGAKDEVYMDVTSMGGERFTGLHFINWAKVKPHGELKPQKSVKLPVVKEGSRLFYHVG